jgi:hypothetical protein
MSDRKTDIVYQHWSRVIQYESRDATALKLNAARALADRDVRSNPTLEGMIQAAIQKRWERARAGDRGSPIPGRYRRFGS